MCTENYICYFPQYESPHERSHTGTFSNSVLHHYKEQKECTWSPVLREEASEISLTGLEAQTLRSSAELMRFQSDKEWQQAWKRLSLPTPQPS